MQRINRQMIYDAKVLADYYKHTTAGHTNEEARKKVMRKYHIRSHITIYNMINRKKAREQQESNQT